jgi:hypothetical protein
MCFVEKNNEFIKRAHLELFNRPEIGGWDGGGGIECLNYG